MKNITTFIYAFPFTKGRKSSVVHASHESIEHRHWSVSIVQEKIKKTPHANRKMSRPLSEKTPMDTIQEMPKMQETN